MSGTVCCIRCSIAVLSTTPACLQRLQRPKSGAPSLLIVQSHCRCPLTSKMRGPFLHSVSTRDARVMRKPDKRPYTAVQERGNKVDRIGLWEAKTKLYSAFGMAGLIRPTRPTKRCLIRRCCLWLYAFGGAAKQRQLTLYCAGQWWYRSQSRESCHATIRAADQTDSHTFRLYGPNRLSV